LCDSFALDALDLRFLKEKLRSLSSGNVLMFIIYGITIETGFLGGNCGQIGVYFRPKLAEIIVKLIY
jgi:hypothetical protein